MPTQAEWNQLFQDIAGAFGVLKRARDSADTLFSNTFLISRYQDPNDFFTQSTVVDDFKYVAGLQRGVNYQLDGIFRMKIKEVTAGATFSLEWYYDYGATKIASATGAFNTYVDLVPDEFGGPSGQIRVQAPTTPVPAFVEVMLEVNESGSFLIELLAGTSSSELDMRNSAQESLRITADSLKNEFYPSLKEVVFDAKLALGIIKEFVGSASSTVLNEEIETTDDGAVRSVPTGILVDLARLMEVDSQTIQRNVVSAGTPSYVGVGDGTLTVTARENAFPDELRLVCTQGFSDARTSEDPEEFRVEIVSPEEGEGFQPDQVLRIFQSWELDSVGLRLQLDRDTTHTDVNSIVNSVDLTKVNIERIPLFYLDVVAQQAAGTDYLIITEPLELSTLFESEVVDGVNTLSLANGIRLVIDLNAANIITTPRTFTINITPFVRGDLIRAQINNDLGGKFQTELMRVVNYRLPSSASPTIDDDYLPDNFPFVRRPVGLIS